MQITSRETMDGINVQSYSQGSVTVNATVSPSPTQSATDLYDLVNSNVNSISSSNFNLLSSSVAPSGFTNQTPTDSGTNNSSVFIGIGAGVGILALIIISTILLI